MFVRLTILVCFALCAFAGYFGMPGFDSREASAAAANAQEVVDAWDAVCATYNFDECPADVLSGLCTTTVGDLYNGSDFSADIDGLMEGMGDELNRVPLPDPPINNDLINLFVEDEAWQL